MKARTIKIKEPIKLVIHYAETKHHRRQKKINKTVKKALNGWKKNEISCIFSYEL